MSENYSASDEKTVQDQEKANELARKQELEDIRFLMDNKPGQRFLKRLMRDGMVFTTTFTGNSQGMFLEGHRNLALKYFADVVEVRPEKLPLIIIEKENK